MLRLLTVHHSTVMTELGYYEQMVVKREDRFMIKI
jgi:hypothetical protein